MFHWLICFDKLLHMFDNFREFQIRILLASKYYLMAGGSKETKREI
jgi:hypothetical protein